MNSELRTNLKEKARENGVKHGKTAELDFGAGAEWMYEQLQNTSSNSDYAKCKEALRLMLAAAHEADRCCELYDSFDGELLDMAQEALK